MALSSKEDIPCPGSVTFECRVSNVDVNESIKVLKSAASASLCSSRRELISDMLMLVLALLVFVYFALKFGHCGCLHGQH